MRKILVALCLGLSAQLCGQAICGFDAANDKLLKTDSAYARRLKQNNTFIQDYITAHPETAQQNGAGTALYLIPVAVHVINTGGPVGSIYNPGDAQIMATIDYLNQVYDGTAAGLSGGVGDIQIQFVMAKRDPDCNATNGIDRYDASGITGYSSNGINRANTSGTDELTIKDATGWDPSKYYNIWVVNKIDGKDGTSGTYVAGFSYFPGSPAAYDGIIMLATQFTVGNKVLPHEMGHAFNLYHPFQGSTGSTNCPANNNCSVDGDKVCDTDPITQNVTNGVYNFSCRTGTNTCTNTAYNINTESNIMNYTNCFTLFTAGQKARMLASMNLASRASLVNSLGGTATYSGAVQCPPKINFEVASSSVKEETDGVSGCRGYIDYTYNLVPGNSPNVAATATLQFSGTASYGTDYLVTTNGSFTSPSAVVNFPAGSYASQPFTVRIYDDGALEADETIILDFTLSSNGGNAVKGESIPTQTILIRDNDVVPAPSIAEQATVGTYTTNLGTTAAGQPFDAKLLAKKTSFLYKASELKAQGLTAGTISGFGVYLAKNSTRAFANLQIRMGTTSLQYLVDGSASSVPATTVKSVASYNTVNGLNLFTLDAPFAWDGTSNLFVQICYGNSTASSTQLDDICQGYSDGGSSTQGNMFWQNINCGSSYTTVNYYTQGVKPVARFVLGANGPQIETALSSGSAYLGPNQEVYFYDNAGNILARIKNLSAFDYGCTQVIIDRSGNGSEAYNDHTAANAVADKAVQVIPANNNPGGSYEITLFYKQAEIAGWQTATGRAWSSVKMLKTPNAVSSYTAGQIPDNVVTSSGVIRGAYGSDSTVTAIFSNGFSGFAVGNPVFATPGIYTFTGNGNWTAASNWMNNTIPPAILPAGSQIIINPQAGGQCILNTQQTIQPGAILYVSQSKSFVIQGNLQMK